MGVIISFDPAGSVVTYPGSINPQGLIVGGFADANSILHGFVRRVDGAITNFDATAAASTAGEGTLATGVTPAGLSTGYCVGAKLIVHGFIRYPSGYIYTFDAPGAINRSGSGSFQGTVPEGMNDWAEIVGYFIDSKGVRHGFIRW